MHRRFTSLLRLSLLVILIGGVLFPPQFPAYAAGTLTVTPLTWNIIGLDSNSPTSGPYRFPIGASVCASGYTYPQTITSNFVFDDGANLYTGGTYINLRSGSLSSVSLTFNSSGCQDVYYEVEVKQLNGAYDTTRAYHITATDGSLTASTPTPRELYVEHLISQSRNAITNVQLNGTSIPAGGGMTLMVGNTYTITLTGGTATQGYNQFESFINFPNTIFQVLSVSTTYSADDSPYVPAPNPQLYADACKWENNPSSPYYRSCIGGDYKAGGNNVVTTYVIKVISGGGSSQTLNTLLYDFSGSSYHYNADYSTGFRIANIVDPSNVTISKSFSPNPTNVNGVSALTITITNPNPGAISGFNFSDPLPANMAVANPTGATTSSCGTPTFAPTAGATSIAFSNGTIAANGSCTINVNVTTTTTGSFTNTTNHLLVDSLDTGKFATSILTVNSAPPVGSGVCGLSLAKWTFPTGSSTTAPVVDAGATVTATASAGNGLTPILSGTTSTADGTVSWGSNGAYDSTGALNTGSNDYFEFALNTTGYTSVNLSFMARRPIGNSPTQILVYAGSSATPPGTLNTTLGNPPTTEFPVGTNTWEPSGAINFTPATGLNSSGTTYFRIYGAFAKNNNPGSDLYVDDVTFTGCGTALKPAISKSFSPNPVAVNGTSTLTFTLSNTNNSQLTGAKFQDTLPTGVVVATPATFSTTCTGSPTWAPVAGASQLDFGQTTGANIPGGSVATPGTCTVSVLVQATTAGPHNNISGFLSTTESGTTTTSVASANLTAVLAPVISKLFTTDPILAGGISTLAFTITNPNQNDALSSIGFTDTFPISPGAMTISSPLTTNNSCNGSLQDNLGGVLAAGDAGIRLTGGTLNGGSSCTVTVKVTAPTVGTYSNNNVTVSHVINASTVNGNTTSATLTVSAPHPAVTILKQVSVAASGPWYSFLPVSSGTTVYYRFIVENAGDIALSAITVSDNVLGAICTIAGPLNPFESSTCTASTTATGSGTHTNIAAASVTYSGTPYSDTSTAAYGIATLSLTKRADETYFLAAGNTLHYYYDVTTASIYPLLGPVTITDDKTTVVCPALSSVGNGDDYLNSGETLTCSATYNTSAGDVTAKLVTNNATARIGAVTSNPSSKTIPLAPDLTLSKTNDTNNAVGFGSTFDWTLTVNNSASAGAATFIAGQTILVDDLPATGATYSVGSITYGTTTGTISCSVTANTLTCTANGGNVTILPGGSFSVPLTVTPTSTGTLSNPRGGGACQVDPGTGVIPELDESNNSCATNTVTVLSLPTIAKTFSPSTIVSGGTSTITFALTNPNTSQLLGGSFSDTLSNMSISGAQNAGGSCVGASSNSFANGDTNLSFTGLTIPASGSCTVTVVITSSTAGVNPNVTSGVTTTQTSVGTPSTSVNLTVTLPVVTIAVNPVSVAEDGVTNLVYTVTLDQAPALDTVINLSTTGTAIGSDYTGSVTTVTILAGATTATVTINPTTDSVVEPDETVIITITPGTGYSVGAPSGATGAITNDDIPIATITVNPASVVEDGATNLVYTVTLDKAPLIDTTINLSTAGTASGLDYTGSLANVTILAGTTSATVTIDPTPDTTIESDETVVITIDLGTGYSVGVPSSATGTITNDDIPVATITVNPASVAEDGSTNLVYTVTLDKAPLVDTVINLATTGTATGSDSTGSVTSVTILAGATSGTVTINPTADTTVEPDETVIITINSGTGYTVGVPASATGTITNDDIPVATIAVNPVSVVEDGATNLVYTVTLDQAPLVDTTVNLTTTGTASGSDFTGSVTSVTILAGTTSGTITIAPTADTMVEPDETVIITINSGTGYTVGVPSSATGTITNDDIPVATITVNPASVAEDGSTNLVYTVTLDKAPLVDTTINLITTGTAAGSDYTGSVTSVTILAGTTSATVTIDPTADTTVEPDETVIITVDSGTGYTVGAPSSATGTITNDDIPVATITVVPASVAEDGATNLVYTVTLDKASLVDTVINLTTTGTASSAGDYSGSVATVTIMAGTTTGTITIDPTADTTVEPDETVIVTIDSGTGYTVGIPSSATGTITNDDISNLPDAIDDSDITNEGMPVTTSVLTNDDLGTTPTTITANTPGANGTVSCTTTQCTYTPNAGFSGTDTYTYTITDNNANTDTATVTITVNKSLIGISKQVVSKTEVSAGTWDITYEILVQNFGTVALNGVQVLDDLTTTFPAPNAFSVRSLLSADFAENTSYNGSTDIALLIGADSLAVSASGKITLVVRVVPASAGPFNNIAIASGQCPTCSTPVTDMSQDGIDPDPDGDNNPTNNNISTPVDFGPNLFDPPFGLKTFDQSGLPVLQWTMVWINNSNILAINAQVSDPISAGTTYAGGLSCTPSGVTTTSLCSYEAPSGSYPRGRILWNGNLGPDLGATDAASASNEIAITFNVNVNTGITSVQNIATVDSDLNGDQDLTDPGEQLVSSASRTWTQTQAITSNRLPDSGFAPNVVTDLSHMPHEIYTAAEALTLEITSLGVKISIVGVPKKNGTWNVSWLGNQAGWLQGTAFPSWNGNSVLTGHIYNSNGLPGPFVNLNKLKYGDQIIIHAYGQKYIFEVQTNDVVEPNDKSVLKHEEKPWLTLVTCKDYDEKTNTYKKRVVVRAVLVKVTTE